MSNRDGKRRQKDDPTGPYVEENGDYTLLFGEGLLKRWATKTRDQWIREARKHNRMDGLAWGFSSKHASNIFGQLEEIERNKKWER